MSVPESKRGKSQLETAVKARDLAKYTITICSNQKNFPPDYQRTLTDDLVSIAKDIYMDVWTANNVRVDGDKGKWETRKKLQENAALKCVKLLALIDLAGKVFHLRANRKKYWGEKVIDLRKSIKAWHESDQARFKGL